MEKSTFPYILRHIFTYCGAYSGIFPMTTCPCENLKNCNLWKFFPYITIWKNNPCPTCCGTYAHIAAHIAAYFPWCLVYVKTSKTAIYGFSKVVGRIFFWKSGYRPIFAFWTFRASFNPNPSSNFNLASYTKFFSENRSDVIFFMLRATSGGFNPNPTTNFNLAFWQGRWTS